MRNSELFRPRFEPQTFDTKSPIYTDISTLGRSTKWLTEYFWLNLRYYFILEGIKFLSHVSLHSKYWYKDLDRKSGYLISSYTNYLGLFKMFELV